MPQERVLGLRRRLDWDPWQRRFDEGTGTWRCGFRAPLGGERDVETSYLDTVKFTVNKVVAVPGGAGKVVTAVPLETNGNNMKQLWRPTALFLW